jgi:hypothetical protein
MALKIRRKGKKNKRKNFFVFVRFYCRPMRNPATSLVDKPIGTVIPRAVYDYATVVNRKLESPRQNKLDHDIMAMLGSSDPPPGFGFLHPRFYYLEQARPVPLEPLQVSILFLLNVNRIKEKNRVEKRKINLYSIVTIPNPFSL